MKSLFITAKFFHHHRFLNVVAILFTALFLSGILNPVASEASGPTFPVMNTSETPPDGVWFRNSPHTADTDRVTGHGVYSEDSVQLACYAFGDAVGPYNDKLWYYVSNLTRPTVPGTNKPNVGYLNAHYINDGKLANQIDAGVPQCGSTPAPPPQPHPLPGGASVYYSPFKSDHISSSNPKDSYDYRVKSVASETLYIQDWTSKPRCNTAKAGAFNDVYNNTSTVTILSGWSLGRMGPIYFLKAFPDRAKHIHYIVLFDPGSLQELNGDCYSNQISQILKTWLDYDPSNKLVIMAGEDTRDWDSRVTINGRIYAHQGIQRVYFSQLRDPQISRRVTVCNYDDMRHEKVWMNFQNIVNQPPIQNTCPPAPGARTGPAPWHP